MCIISSEDIKVALHKADLMLHPYYLFCNEIDKELIKEILPNGFILQSVPDGIIEHGKVIVIERAELEYF